MTWDSIINCILYPDLNRLVLNLITINCFVLLLELILILTGYSKSILYTKLFVVPTALTACCLYAYLAYAEYGSNTFQFKLSSMFLQGLVAVIGAIHYSLVRRQIKLGIL